MPYFFILDQTAKLYRVEAEDAKEAVWEYNGSNRIRSDYCVPALPCGKHNDRFLNPDFPEWMGYEPTSNCRLCYLCSAEAKEPVTIKTFPEKPIAQFFTHNKESLF